MIRGFMLVELIAIIIVLALIFLVAFPNLVNIEKDDKEKQYETMKKDLCTAGENYIYSNKDYFGEFETNKQIKISIEDLIKQELVSETLKDVKTNEEVKNGTLIYKVLDDKTLECEYVK